MLSVLAIAIEDEAASEPGEDRLRAMLTALAEVATGKAMPPAAKEKAAKAEVTEAYAKASADGLNIKVLRTLIRERKLDAAQLSLFHDTLALYRAALATTEH